MNTGNDRRAYSPDGMQEGSPYAVGMSLLIRQEVIEEAKAKEVIDRHNAVYHSIVPVEDTLNSHRDRYC